MSRIQQSARERDAMEGGPTTNAFSAAYKDLREVAVELMQSRELLLQLTLRDIRIRYKQAAMGVIWAVITPLVIVLSGAIFRIAIAKLANVPTDSAVLAGLAIKSLGWAFFVGALGFATASITANLTLITKVYFAREVLPLASVLTQIVDVAIGGALLAIVLPMLGLHISSSLLWLPVLAAILLLLTTAACLLFSCLNVFFRDAKHLVQFFMSFGIFFTPVFFEPELFGQTGARLIMLNPVAPVLEGMRLAVVYGHDLLTPLIAASGAVAWQPWYLAYAGAWGVGGLVISALIFHRSEFVFAEYV